MSNVKISRATRMIFESLPEAEANRFMREVFAFTFDGVLPESESIVFRNFRTEFEAENRTRENAARRQREHRNRIHAEPSAVAPAQNVGGKLYDDLCAAYPLSKRNGLGKATGSLRNALLRHPGPEFPDQLLQAVREYAEAVSQWPEEEQHYALSLDSFLNADHYLDDRKHWKSRIEANNTHERLGVFG